MAVFEATEVILDPLVNLWNSFVTIIPGLIAAIILLFIGYFVALFLGHVVRVILEKVRVDKKVEKAHLFKKVGKTNLSAIIGEIIKWYVFIVFLGPAADVLQLGTLSTLLGDFSVWLLDLIAAIIVLLAGVMLMHFVGHKIEEHTSMSGVKTVSTITKAIVGFVFLVIALKQVGLEVSILENAFLLIVGALAAGVALALGIGLGFGLKPEAKNLINEIKKSF